MDTVKDLISCMMMFKRKLFVAVGLSLFTIAGYVFVCGTNSYAKTKPTALQNDQEIRWLCVAAGASHSLAIKTDGTLWSWGENLYGQLGDGTKTNKLVPVQIGHENNWRNIAASGMHSIAIKADGTMWAWGLMDYRQSPSKTVTPVLTPTQVGTDNNWLQVSAGYGFNLALKTDGTLWTWGTNRYGQLGNGVNGINDFVAFPTVIEKRSKWKMVCAGNTHAMGIKEDGTLWTWGYNLYGKLGDGTTENRNKPTHIGKTTKWFKCSAGTDCSLAIRSDSTLWTWGNNSFGELGYEINAAPVGFLAEEYGENVTKQQLFPAQLKLDSILFIDIVEGSSFGFFISTEQNAYCCGNNFFGQLGLGDNKNITIPKNLTGKWKQISLGTFHALAVAADGSLWSWGYNRSGQLGNGETANKFSPIKIN